MPDADYFTATGTVVVVVRGFLSGRLRRNHIRCMVDDHVELAVALADPFGPVRVTYRH